MILLSESRQGYPTHLFYALGHMAEAGDELVKEYPMYAGLVRAERKQLEEDPNYSPDFERLLVTVSEECNVCQLNPGNPTGLRPSAWTKCELAHPEVQRKIVSCVSQVKGKPGVENPFAVCRAAIKCPG